MYLHNIDPTFLSIGPLEIRFYGIVWALGFLLIYWFIYKKRKELNIKSTEIDSFLIFLTIGIIIGARIFHFLFSDPLIFFRDPFELFRIWHGGLSFFGSLIGGLIASHYYLKKIKVNFKGMADEVFIAITIGLIFGRIANFINGELVGIPTDVSWCVIFTQVDNLCRHPYQLYASFSHAILLGIVLIANKIKYKSERPRYGLVFVTFIIGYTILRFITDFVREDPRFLGLTSWQYVSLAALIVGLIWLYKEKHK